MAFTAFTGNQRIEMQREHDARLRSTPFARFEYVDVTFGSGGVDVDIPHTLNPTNVETVRWLVVTIDANTAVYRDTSGTAKAWQTDHIWLRAGAACDARLLLFIEA